MEIPTENKTAIILIGGAMRSAYSGGFLSTLAREFPHFKPDIMIGSSADAGNVLYFCAEQYSSLKRVWQDLLSTPKFISARRIFKIMDVDYLIDTVFKKQEPLDIGKVRNSSTDWYIALTDVDHGVVRYAHKGDTIDTFELLRAAKAIPLLYNKKIPLSSTHGVCQYIDGEFGATLTSHITCAVKAGATRIFIIKNNAPWSWYRKCIVRLYLYTLPPKTRQLLRQDLESSSELTTTAVDYPHITIQLHTPPDSIGTTTRSTTLLTRTFAAGEANALAMEPELRMLFSI